MKRLFAGLLCLLLVGLCACGQMPLEETSTVTSTAATAVQETSIEAKATEKATAENALTNRYGQSIVEIITNKNDPYSYVVKEYNDYLNNDDSAYYWTQFYALYDVDGNETRELLLGGEWANRGIGILHVYTTRNGVAVRQEGFYWDPEESPPPMLLNNGTIRRSGTGGYDFDGSYSAYYRIEAGELKFQLTLKYAVGNYFRSDRGYENPITKEEYDRVQQEMEGDGKTVELDWKPLAEYGKD